MNWPKSKLNEKCKLQWRRVRGSASHTLGARSLRNPTPRANTRKYKINCSSVSSSRFYLAAQFKPSSPRSSKALPRCPALTFQHNYKIRSILLLDYNNHIRTVCIVWEVNYVPEKHACAYLMQVSLLCCVINLPSFKDMFCSLNVILFRHQLTSMN